MHCSLVEIWRKIMIEELFRLPRFDLETRWITAFAEI